jgi:hypothetical protein
VKVYHVFDNPSPVGKANSTSYPVVIESIVQAHAVSNFTVYSFGVHSATNVILVFTLSLAKLNAELSNVHPENT